MNPKSTVLAAFVAAALASAGAFAQSPTTPNPPSPPAPDMKGQAPTPKMSEDKASPPKMVADAKVEADYRAAQTACDAQPVATRAQCLTDAKNKYDRDLRSSQMNNSKSTSGTNAGGGNGTSGSAGTAGDSGGHSGGTSGAGAGTAGGDNGGHSGGTGDSGGASGGGTGQK